MYDRLKKEIEALQENLGNTSLRKLSRQLGISASTLHNFFSKGAIPIRKWQKLSENIRTLFSHEQRIQEIIHNINQILIEEKNKEKEEMILRKQNLSSLAKTHFNIVKNPLADPRNASELYLNKKSRFIRECLLDAAQNGNFLALVGESGSGKSTLRMELLENLKHSQKPVIIIEPYTFSMSRDGRTGTLKTRHLLEAILSTLSPDSSIHVSPEMLAKKVHKSLLESYRAGFKHCLIIEEAHDLHTHTLKAFKSF